MTILLFCGATLLFAGGQEQDYIEGVQLRTIDIAKVSSAPMG